MGFEKVAEIVFVAIGIITMIIGLRKMMPYQRITEIDQFKAAKEALDKSSNSFHEKLHPYTKEIASRIITRSDFISARELEYFLNLEDTHRCLKDFVRSKNCFKPIAENGNQELEFKGYYRSKCIRNFLKKVMILLYFAFASAAILPILVVEQLTSIVHGSILLVLMVPSSIYIAWVCGNFSVTINRAEKLRDASKKWAISLKGDI